MTVSLKNGIDTMGQPTRSRHMAQKKNDQDHKNMH